MIIAPSTSSNPWAFKARITSAFSVVTKAHPSQEQRQWSLTPDTNPPVLARKTEASMAIASQVMQPTEALSATSYRQQQSHSFADSMPMQYTATAVKLLEFINSWEASSYEWRKADPRTDRIWTLCEKPEDAFFSERWPIGVAMEQLVELIERQPCQSAAQNTIVSKTLEWVRWHLLNFSGEDSSILESLAFGQIGLFILQHHNFLLDKLQRAGIVYHYDREDLFRLLQTLQDSPHPETDRHLYQSCLHQVIPCAVLHDILTGRIANIPYSGIIRVARIFHHLLQTNEHAKRGLSDRDHQFIAELVAQTEHSPLVPFTILDNESTSSTRSIATSLSKTPKNKSKNKQATALRGLSYKPVLPEAKQ